MIALKHVLAVAFILNTPIGSSMTTQIHSVHDTRQECMAMGHKLERERDLMFFCYKKRQPANQQHQSMTGPWPPIV